LKHKLFFAIINLLTKVRMVTAAYLTLIWIVAIAATVVDVGLMLLTNPTAIGPLGATAWFLVFFLGLLVWLTLAFYWLAGKFDSPTKMSPKKNRLFPAWRRGLLGALWVTIVVGLSSLQQLSLRDVLLTGILIALTEVYFRAKA
jgi:hypothetical protein